TKVSTAQKHSGSYSAAMGYISCGAQTTAQSSLLQQYVTIPSYATAATLSFWYRPQTNDTNQAHDYFQVEILSSSGSLLASVLKTASNSQTWTNETFTLTPYLGDGVYVRFIYYNNGSTQGGAYVDDVDVNLK